MACAVCGDDVIRDYGYVEAQLQTMALALTALDERLDKLADAVDNSLINLSRRMDKLEADNANMRGELAMTHYSFRTKLEPQEPPAEMPTGTVLWAPVTAEDPPKDKKPILLINDMPSESDYALPYLGWRDARGFYRNLSNAYGSFMHPAPTHFARIGRPIP